MSNLTIIPEWANWIARDSDIYQGVGELYAFEKKPVKLEKDFWHVEDWSGEYELIEEFDDTFKSVSWNDWEPTRVNQPSTKGTSLEEIKSKMSSVTAAFAQGFDELPQHVPTHTKDNKEDRNTSPEKEDTYDWFFNNKDTEYDIVNKPNHYVGEQGLEVETVLQNFIPRYTDTYEGHRIASAIEYLLRSPLKNGIQDIEKAKKNLEQVITYREMLEEKK